MWGRVMTLPPTTHLDFPEALKRQRAVQICLFHTVYHCSAGFAAESRLKPYTVRSVLIAAVCELIDNTVKRSCGRSE